MRKVIWLWNNYQNKLMQIYATYCNKTKQRSTKSMLQKLKIDNFGCFCAKWFFFTNCSCSKNGSIHLENYFFAWRVRQINTNRASVVFTSVLLFQMNVLRRLTNYISISYTFVCHGPLVHPNIGYGPLNQKRCNEYLKLNLNHRSTIVIEMLANPINS